MNFLQNTISVFTCALTVLLLQPVALMAQEAAKSVAILPFTLNAPPDKQYLSEGLRDMLGSRLRSEAGAMIVSRDTINSAAGAAGIQAATGQPSVFARQVGADYLVYGAITALGGGISIDAKVFAAVSGPTGGVQNFYSSATSNDQVMRAIDTLSWDILEKYFGKNRPAALQPAQQQAAVPSGSSTFTSAHPDKTFMATGGGFALTGGRNFVKTRNFTMELRGFDVGDVDGDGTPEIILADRSEVKVFRRDGTRMNLLGMVKMLARYQIHSVNAADLNGNGRAEIYISASDPTTAGSRAVEWNGTGFDDLFNEARWYIRPMKVTGAGLVLVGQGGSQIPLDPAIYMLGVTGGQLQKQERLPVPNGVNLFNFVFADLDGNGKDEVVAVDNSFKLRVYQGGNTTWRSDERFCGTKRFIGGEPPMMSGRSVQQNEEVDGVGERFKEIFVPSRIMVSDVDKDGVDDIILNRNPDSITTVSPTLTQYPSGTLVGLKWNGLGLEELWRTRQIDGYVVDYQVKSLSLEKEKGDDELFIGMMLDTGSFNPLSSDQSTVVIYPFEFELPETK